ncbi:MAG: RAMP superfamily CRISPR-associated protein [Thermodesulfobacteriota bacterium]
MPHYRVQLQFLSPIGTPLLSDTLWGHLAWAIRYLDGEGALDRWLQSQLQRPWVLSSAMPVGCLPTPLLKPVLRRDKGVGLRRLEELKKVKKARYIREEDFLALRDRMCQENLQSQLVNHPGTSEALPPVALRQARNRIDRRTSRTPESGGLYFLDDIVYSGGSEQAQFFVSTSEPEEERLKRLLEFVGENGFGRKSSVGRGAFNSRIEEEIALFSGGGNRLMNLSHGVLTANMVTCRYRLHTHFGKLGAHLARGRFSPFKFPILMMAPGATFTPRDRGPFGLALEGVHHEPALAGVRHHALHLTIPFTETGP